MLVDGYKGNKYHGFKSLEEAKAYMRKHGVLEYTLVGHPGDLSSKVAMGDRAYYAVANGREAEIIERSWYALRPSLLEIY